MSRVATPGKLQWTLSDSADAIAQRVYMDQNGDGVSYTDPYVEIAGDVTEIFLPIEGLPNAIEGITQYGVSVLDGAGNEADIIPVDVEVDVTPPNPVTNLVFIPNV